MLLVFLILVLLFIMSGNVIDDDWNIVVLPISLLHFLPLFSLLIIYDSNIIKMEDLYIINYLSCESIVTVTFHAILLYNNGAMFGFNAAK